jgi:hypothetical protein
MNDPNNYGKSFHFTKVKGGLTVDTTKDNIGPKKGYLMTVIDLYSDEEHHSRVDTAGQNLSEIVKKTKFLVLVGHGISGVLGIGTGRFFNGKCSDKCISLDNQGIWETIFGQLSTNRIENLYLLSCFTGAGEKGAKLLHTLANSINATVVAPTGRILLFPGSGLFQLEAKAEWQVAQPSGPQPDTINAPPVKIAEFTNKIRVFNAPRHFEVPVKQITSIGIASSTNLNKWNEIPAEGFVPLLSMIEFITWENLDDGVMASLVTGILKIEFDTNDGYPIEKVERKYFILSNRYLQDSVYPNIVYPCKEEIENYLSER